MKVSQQLQPYPIAQAGPGRTGLAALPGVKAFTLPLGYVDDQEQCHREAELWPLTGQEQRLIASFPPSTPVATITTELLCRCLTRLGSIPHVDRNVVRNLLVSDREFLLLKVFEITFGNSILALLSCPAEGCGESLEFPVALDHCRVEASPVSSRTLPLKPSDKEERSIRFRLPTGQDQETLAACCDLPADALLERLLSACCAEPDGSVLQDLGPKERVCIENQMSRLAPQVEVEVEALCPECGCGFSTGIDAPYLALAQMKISDTELDREVHYLAWHYHWPESEILTLTPPRRRRYIDLVQRETERTGDC